MIHNKHQEMKTRELTRDDSGKKQKKPFNPIV